MKSKSLSFLAVIALICVFTASCNNSEDCKSKCEKSEMQKLIDEYAVVDLKADISHLSENQKEMLRKLFQASDIMEELFWEDAIENKEIFLARIDDPETAEYAKINYGPWDRLNANESFIDRYASKPKGANYYPIDITSEEFDDFDDENKMSWYTLLRRDNEGNLRCVWYHQAYAEKIEKAAVLLDEAAELAEDQGFKKYLKLRAQALRTDEYLESDLAWMDMKNNMVDIVIGPIESYEDAFKGIKAAHSGQILIKDLEWSKKLESVSALLPAMQKALPVEDKYKMEEASTDGDLNVYNVVYYRGDCNSGSKNIAINLPNDPRVHLAKGSRRLQLKNSMQAKFDKILIPISEILIEEDQIKHVNFEDAFFPNVMYHEVAHGLGVHYTINDNVPVREALAEYYSALEEAKADIAGLFLITKLHEIGEIVDKDLMDNYVTFLAGIFRSVRFGVASSHGKANLLEFYYLRERGAFNLNAETGKYSVNFDKMKSAVEELVNDILVVQGDGDKQAAKEWLGRTTVFNDELQTALDKISEAGIPKDIVFNQGLSVLGL